MWFTAVTFAWNAVIPAVREIFSLVGSGTYKFIADQVDNVDIMAMEGIEKRGHVYNLTEAWLTNKGVEVENLSSVVIFLLIEIAVVNLRRKQKKLTKN